MSIHTATAALVSATEARRAVLTGISPTDPYAAMTVDYVLRTHREALADVRSILRRYEANMTQATRAAAWAAIQAA